MPRVGRFAPWVALIVAVACSSPGTRPDAAHDGDVALPLDTETVEGRVPRDATLSSLLHQQKIDGDLATSLTAAVRAVFNPRDLRADRSYRVIRTLDGLFREFQYQVNANQFLRVIFRNRDADGRPAFDVAIVPYRSRSRSTRSRRRLHATTRRSSAPSTRSARASSCR